MEGWIILFKFKNMCYYYMWESGVGARGIPVESEEVFEVSFLSLFMHFQGQMQVSGLEQKALLLSEPAYWHD